ncbi:hypothetical protein [Candidatus Methylacidithermus pantelleriae]|nr:hypothetical protein [Candidatus Methylacidithermus pantelleriae]
METNPLSDIDSRERLAEAGVFVLRQLHKARSFFQRDWRASPSLFPLSLEEVRFLEKLGRYLYRFTRACDLLYHWSLRGKAPAWVSELLDRGKPPELIELGRDPRLRGELPLVIRPDLVLTPDGFALCELDSVPGGIGLTAWLQEVYAGLGEQPIGGAKGIREAFDAIFPTGEVVIAEEARGYWPEFEYLVGASRVVPAEGYRCGNDPIYRFFECFDWMNLSSLRQTYRPGSPWMTPPLKAYLEEKMWLALFWMRPLRSFWLRELSEKGFRFLQSVIPYSWVVDPTPLPPHAVIPELGIQDWRELGRFSQKEREVVLKISGFSPLAWGARGVFVGSDLPQIEWAKKVEEAIQSFATHPFILQRFVKGRVVRHYWIREDGVVLPMEGRARVSPFYFIIGEEVRLAGVLVTVCPLDKKLLHGMRDALLVPAKQA